MTLASFHKSHNGILWEIQKKLFINWVDTFKGKMGKKHFQLQSWKPLPRHALHDSILARKTFSHSLWTWPKSLPRPLTREVMKKFFLNCFFTYFCFVRNILMSLECIRFSFRSAAKVCLQQHRVSSSTLNGNVKITDLPIEIKCFKVLVCRYAYVFLENTGMYRLTLASTGHFCIIQLCNL